MKCFNKIKIIMFTVFFATINQHSKMQAVSNLTVYNKTDATLYYVRAVCSNGQWIENVASSVPINGSYNINCGNANVTWVGNGSSPTATYWMNITDTTKNPIYIMPGGYIQYQAPVTKSSTTTALSFPGNYIVNVVGTDYVAQPYCTTALSCTNTYSLNPGSGAPSITSIDINSPDCTQANATVNFNSSSWQKNSQYLANGEFYNYNTVSTCLIQGKNINITVHYSNGTSQTINNFTVPYINGNQITIFFRDGKVKYAVGQGYNTQSNYMSVYNTSYNPIYLPSSSGGG